MNVKDIFERSIKEGMKADPRGKAGVKRHLDREKKRYDKLTKDKKKEYDKERLWNPYADSRILYGEKSRPVKRVLMGVNIDTGEVLLADRLGEKGKPIDLVIAHHPRGKAMAALHDVMGLQADFYNQIGVPINVAEGVMEERIAEVERAVMPRDHNQAVDAARLLDVPIICTHTPSDNMVQRHVQKHLDKGKPDTVEDVVELLKQIPEYRQAVALNFGPKIVAGKGRNRCGKVVVKFTGGTEGAQAIYEKVVEQGVGTWVCMHMSDKNITFAKEHHLNVVIAGHMSSDSIGMNLLYAGLEKEGIELVRCSGLLPPK